MEGFLALIHTAALFTNLSFYPLSPGKRLLAQNIRIKGIGQALLLPFHSQLDHPIQKLPILHANRLPQIKSQGTGYGIDLIKVQLIRIPVNHKVNP